MPLPTASKITIWRLNDLVAGVSVAGLMLPEAVAYAGIAGLEPRRAIFAAIAGALVYAVAGRSRFAIVAPTSSSAAILTAAISTIPGDASTKAALATIAVAMTGALFLVSAVARLGSLAGFIARPVLRGFAFGLATTIIMKQVPTLLGLDVHAPDVFRLTGAIASHAADINPVAAAVGASALVLLFWLKRFPILPGAFIVLMTGVAASAALDLKEHGVATVGFIDAMPSWPALPNVPWQTISTLAQLTLPLVLILFAESWGTMRALALRHGDTLEPDREMRALGLANIASALAQGMPVGAGFSAGSASEAAGSSSRATGAIAAVGLALLVWLGAPMIAKLPEPVLAAVVVAALAHALNPAPLIRLWKIDRDQYVALAAASGVVAFGVVDGMLIAIALSLAALLRRMAAPHVVRLGRLNGGHNYVSTARHPEAVPPDGITVWRPSEPLFFASAERVFSLIDMEQGKDTRTKRIVVSLEETVDLDSTALESMLEFDARIRAAGVVLHLARVRDPVRDILNTAGAADLAARCHYSVDDAVEASAAWKTSDASSNPHSPTTSTT